MQLSNADIRRGRSEGVDPERGLQKRGKRQSRRGLRREGIHAVAEIPTFVGEAATAPARTTPDGGPTTTRRLRCAQTVLADGQRSLRCPLR